MLASGMMGIAFIVTLVMLMVFITGAQRQRRRPASNADGGTADMGDGGADCDGGSADGGCGGGDGGSGGGD